MSSIEEIRADRLKKLELLRDSNTNPYPAETKQTHSVNKVLANFDDLQSSGEKIGLAGRVMSVREHGGSTFFDIFDGSARIQSYIKKDEVGDVSYELFLNVVDVGDFLEVVGTLFKTKKDVSSVKVDGWKMLSKSLRPLPGEYYGFHDEEERLRKRYLDILMNQDVRETVEKKAQFWSVARDFMKREGFLEVETPTLETTTGGAEATPFKTYHRDFDMDVYLRISIGELWQKRLMAAGIPRTYEIGRAYRNEGSSPEHVQEFTNLEFYAAYMNFEEGKELVKKLYQNIAIEVFGGTSFEVKGHKFDLSDEWKDIDYVGTVEEKTGINVIEASDKEIEKKLKELSVEYQGDTRERMVDSLWKHCRKDIPGPAFLVNHPKLVAPLSKENPDNPELTKTFQVIIAGSEIGRAHAELNDPLDQKERFLKQQELLDAGDEEAMMPDWEYVEMLEHGMPPTFGFGFGDRLFAYLAGKTIRETQIFPLLKPKNTKNDKTHK